MSDQKVYRYNGPVCSFGKFICSYTNETKAPSPEKALCSIRYKFCQDTNRTANSRIELDKKYLKEV